MDRYEKLKELKTLLDSGVLNQDEFNKLKNEILFDEGKCDETLKDYYKINDEEKIDSTNSFFSDVENNNLSNEYIKNNTNDKKKANLFINIEIIIAVLLGFFIWVEYSNKSNLNDNNESTKNSNFYPKTSTINNSQENILTTCKICGRSFSGDGYDKIDGVWQRNTNMQTELCSSNCAMTDVQSSTSNRTQPNSNGFFTDSDGELHQVSPCGYCHHTGFIDSGDGMQVCPICDGKGEKIY